MSSVVFILGAGASQQCGAPLMADFLDVATHLHRSGNADEKSEDFERVFKAIGKLQAVHSKAQLDLTNIESIFSTLEIARILRKLPGHYKAEEIPKVISSLKELIVKTLEITIRFPIIGSVISVPSPTPVKGSIVGVPSPYDEFTKLLKYLRDEATPRHTVSIITFNYDIAADMALYRAGMGPDYGINISPIAPESGISDPVLLLKLHGSLNWGAREDGGAYPLPLEEYFSDKTTFNNGGGFCKVPIGSQIKEYISKLTPIKMKTEPFLVPPSWNKADHHQGLSEVWAKAARQLEETEYIFIIGYSLPETDAFFRQLYALGTVGQYPLRKIVVYNPDATGQVDARFQGMLGPGAAARYEYRREMFHLAIPDIKRFFK